MAEFQLNPNEFKAEACTASADCSRVTPWAHGRGRGVAAVPAEGWRVAA